jgi:hypothetical protein
MNTARNSSFKSDCHCPSNNNMEPSQKKQKFLPTRGTFVDCHTPFCKSYSTLPRISYNNNNNNNNSVESAKLLFHRRKNRGNGVESCQQQQQPNSVKFFYTNTIIAKSSKVFVSRKSCEVPSNTWIVSKKRRKRSKTTTTTTTIAMVSSWPPKSIWTCLLVILLITNITCHTCKAQQQQHHHHHNRYSNKATLTIFDFTSWSYRAEIANFGNPMHEENGRRTYHATLMIPPANYSQLCQIPDSLTTAAAEALSNSPPPPTTTTTLSSSLFDNNTSTENVVEEIPNQDATETPTSTVAPGTTGTPWQFPGPIALLVSLGGCDATTKVQVIVDLHQRITSDLKYIVFYNNDPNDPDNIATISLSTTTLAPLNATPDQQNSTFDPWIAEQQKILDENLVSCCFSYLSCVFLVGLKLIFSNSICYFVVAADFCFGEH